MRSSKRNPSSPSAGATYLDRDATVAVLRRMVRAAARREAGLVRVVLFGSLASGTPTPRSDADLVVIQRSGAPRRMDRIPALLKLFGASPVPLDLHPYTEAEWEAAVARHDPFVLHVQRKGLDLLS